MNDKSEADAASTIPKWSFGVLNDRETVEVPGTVLLLSPRRNEPLGLEYSSPTRIDSSMPPQPYTPRRSSFTSKKKNRSGSVILEPQPEDSLNDPLNWPAWRRDFALLSLGFYCMLGGGMTPVLAAGFDDVASTFDVSYSRVALTTGLYMMGMGVGGVIFSPTAILYGKRPVYIFSALLFILTSIWCALAPSYAQLATARVFQGFSVSPVECLPSATIAEIFFLHERAFRIGIYTLLLLGGKNLVPLVSAAVIDAMGWRWVFWIVTFIAAFGLCALFLFVPETFWDRTPRPKTPRPASSRSFSGLFHSDRGRTHSIKASSEKAPMADLNSSSRQFMLHKQDVHARFHDGPAHAENDSVVADTRPQAPLSSEIVPQSSDLRQDAPPHTPATDGATEDSQLSIRQQQETLTSISTGAIKHGGRKQPKPTGLRLPPPIHFNGSSEAQVPVQSNHSVDGTSDLTVQQPLTNDNNVKLNCVNSPSGAGDDSPTRASITSVMNSAQPYTAPWDGAGDDKLRVPTIAMPMNTTFAELAERSGTFNQNESLPELHNLNSPYYLGIEKSEDYLGHHGRPKSTDKAPRDEQPSESGASLHSIATNSTVRNSAGTPSAPNHHILNGESNEATKIVRYTTNLRESPPKTYLQTLKPWNGRLSRAHWFLVALRPFLLFAYPAVLWSALVYSLSVGWLIVLSESVSSVYRNRDTYNFSALQCGLVYISPFVGGILGTAIAGKVSDILVRMMARRNGGIYEPEYRLVMGIPIAISTAIGLMGFGWSAEERDQWIVPTVFFGVISFGCSLGSTTAITFCVDSYRDYAGEALVTLNFSKNIFHGLAFSLFFAHWLESEGAKDTFLAIGGIQVACLLSTIPMYIYGKRMRMWTVRKAFMENF
ncbi:hypothetical protein PV10_06903 [Exophiala mesophila]|uniref:Major facilitator superfamily (MFS) profile domain-containing protein n=1 Tax=Exophiala mesophila TaxID=212818 RepID=A0A0D1WKQ4_EXOME|nr:uncharacterized protein PV10_06903 [Exophiala mesophila]KIV89510.1 hypothetical protein PV10_06903 [Exophiala mesophila]